MKALYLFCLMFASSHLNAEVYDCFTFFNELELLKVRFEELYDSVDHFVIVEATATFSGEEKPLYFSENIHHFEKYKDKIIHIIVDDLPKLTAGSSQDHWIRQEFQDNAKLRGLTGCADEDIILSGDLDEIPSKDAIQRIKKYFLNKKRSGIKNENNLICELHMRLFLFHLNCESPYGWPGAVKAAPYWIMKKRLPWNLKILHMYDGNLPKIYNAGWHFHSMGGIERVRAKLRSIYRHNPRDDFPKDSIPNQVLSMVEDWENREYLFIEWTHNMFSSMLIPIDDSYPKYIQDNRDYFQDLGWLREF